MLKISVDELLTQRTGSDPGRSELRLRRVDLRDVVRAAVEALRARGRALSLSLPPQEAIVMADPTRLAQALAGLFADGAGVPRAPLGTDGAAGVSVVRAAANVGVLLERPGAPRPLTRDDERAAQLIQLHGGHIGAPPSGRGPGLSVWLPLADGQAPAPVPAQQDQQDRARMAQAAGRHVLLIEDNPDIRESLQDLLSLLGHRVDVAADGGSGLSLALSLAPEAALVDIGLPGMDGYELARRIRAVEAERGGRAIFLVALTGYGRPEDRQRALQAGFSAHLVKPPDPVQIEQMLAAI